MYNFDYVGLCDCEQCRKKWRIDNMRIYLSPSNQIENKYTGVDTNECEVCYDIATILKDLLVYHNYSVKLAGKLDQVKYRIKEGDAFLGNDGLYVCIHTNAGGGKGTEVFASANSINNHNKYVTNIYKSVAEITPGKDRGIKLGSNIAEVRQPKAVTCYIEVEFHDTYSEWIATHKKEIAYSILEGILKSDGKLDTNDMLIVPDDNKEENLYRVQVGAFRSKENAEKLSKELTDKGYNTIIK